MIVALAGHVDHGKTTLVHLLTGTDTDRLAEEKRRGLTIDLGFAYLEAAGTVLGFVDVPGHHRFIHNMVAGVAARQHALLVIAADDGPMPQSREHLQILELLGVTSGVVALTKCDRVEAERIGMAREQVRHLTTGTFLETAPVIETSAATGTGIDALKSHLLEAAGQLPAAADGRPFRMPVDRAFTLRGTGTVVTGTVHNGEVGVDDELQVFPSGVSVRVRDLRTQDRPCTRARAGDRTAINLGGADTGVLTRGRWLCAEPQRGHHTLVLDFQALDDFPRALRHWTPVHVYHATSHSTAHLALLQGARLPPGERTLVELVLDDPLPGKRGDRVVVRDHALERTIGGGTVIDNRPAVGRRRTPARLRGIEACAAPSAEDALAALLAQGPVQLDAFNGLWDLRPNDFDELLRRQPARQRDGYLVADVLWQSWRDELLDECRRRHAADPALQGLRENDFQAPVPEAFRGRVLAELAAAEALDQRAGRYLPRRHRVALTPVERNLLERLQPHLDQTQPPSLGDLGRTLRIPLDDLKTTVNALASKGAVVQVSDKRVYLSSHLAALAEIAERLARQGPFSVREYRDAAGIGRNVAIDVLEYFDDRGFTRRLGETRTVVGDRSKLLAGLG